jgi:hypothetical protein
MARIAKLLLMGLVVAAFWTGTACQSTSSTDETLDVDDFVDGSAAPNPATAEECTDGRQYRVIRGNNQPDELINYAYTATFSVTVTINKNAADKDIDLDFPVKITATAPKIQQATNGIVVPSTSSDTEHYETVMLAATGSTFSGTNTTVTMTFKIWYSLPNAGKGGLITVPVTFEDDSGVTFTKNVEGLVN